MRTIKKQKTKILYCLLVAFFACSCEDYLDVVPDNVATIDYAFRDRVGVEKYLYTCYTYLPYFGSCDGDPAILGGDDVWVFENPVDLNLNAFHIKMGLQNVNSPLLDFWNGANGGRALWRAIRDCNVFLENVDRVGADLPNWEKIQWKAEVKFLKAYYHYYLLRMYGAIPLIRQNLPSSAGIDEVRAYREPFDECVDYIVELIDEAAPDLPPSIFDRNTELGRITRCIALSVKAELLVMAASPLFNGNPDLADCEDNRGKRLFPQGEENPQKWERAATACKEAIDLCLSEGIILYEFPEYSAYELSDSTRRVMTCRHVVFDKWNMELIWGSSRTNNANSITYSSLPYFTADNTVYAAGRPYISPTLRMAELFYTNHGVPINEDTQYEYDNRYKTAPAPYDHKFYIQPEFETALLNINREPRFYANLGFDGGVWFGNGRYKDVGMGTETETPWILEMKKGQVSGNYNGLRYSVTGYWLKKGSHFETSRTSTGTSLNYAITSYPIMRLADLFLLYAEALNECLPDENATPTSDIYTYVDVIRQRAGLEGVVASWAKYSRFGTRPATKAGMREIIRQERMIELAFEGKRFWDVRRWKTAATLLNQPIKGWNINGTNTAEYYNVVVVETPTFTTKEYLWPIQEEQIRNNPNIVQNPGW